MVSWSSLKHTIQSTFRNRKILETFIVDGKTTTLTPTATPSVFRMQVRRMAGGHNVHDHLELHVSRFHWHKFKDLLHFYIMLGVIPIAAIVFWSSIFVGPAQLSELPSSDDVCKEPKYWEYHRHPITRFISRYVHHSPQQDYEKFLHHIYEENEKAQLRNLEAKIRELMSQRADYQAGPYRPVLSKYLRVSKENAEKLKDLRGDN